MQIEQEKKEKIAKALKFTDNDLLQYNSKLVNNTNKFINYSYNCSYTQGNIKIELFITYLYNIVKDYTSKEWWNCNVDNCINNKENNGYLEYKLKINEVNNILPRVIDIKPKNSLDTISIKEFLYYIGNKIQLLVNKNAENVRKIDTSSNEYLNTNKKLLYSNFMKLNSFVNKIYNFLCNNQILNNRIPKENFNIIKDKLSETINKLNNIPNSFSFISVLKLFDNINSKYRAKCNLIETEDLLDNNLQPLCTNILSDLYKTISTQYSDSNSTKSIYKFGRYYNSITAHLSQEEIEDLSEDFKYMGDNNITLNVDDIEYSRKYLNENTSGVFNLNIKEGEDIKLKQLLQYFANRMSLPTVNMFNKLIYDVNETLPNNKKELYSILKKNIYNCIEEIKHIAHHTVVFLKNDEQFKKAFGNTNVAETITNSIANGIAKLDSLIK